MPDFSIKIVPVDPSNPAGPARFKPQDGQPGQPQEVWVDSNVTWNNDTDAVHQPWPTDTNYKPYDKVERTDPAYMSDEIPARQGSRPTFNVGTKITLLHYYCRKSSARTERTRDDQRDRNTIAVRPCRCHGGESRSSDPRI